MQCYSPAGAMLGASDSQVRGQCTARSGEACQGPLCLNLLLYIRLAQLQHFIAQQAVFDATGPCMYLNLLVQIHLEHPLALESVCNGNLQWYLCRCAVYKCSKVSKCSDVYQLQCPRNAVHCSVLITLQCPNAVQCPRAVQCSVMQCIKSKCSVHIQRVPALPVGSSHQFLLLQPISSKILSISKFTLFVLFGRTKCSRCKCDGRTEF